MKIQSCYPPAPYFIYSYDRKSFPKCRKSSIDSPRGLFISNTFKGGGGGLFNFAQTMVSVHHKELECKVENLKYEKLVVMQPRIKSKLKLPAGEKKYPQSTLSLTFVID